ncbi:hypothetical protein HBI23_198100 [Parastagonospora nodorum]|nr:hypothetical protein HBI23_198100 [Parastagonospora nodorum]
MVPQSNDTFSVRQAGAYRNLPTYPSVSGLTAIVPGATGISGWNTIRALLDAPTRWTKIYAMFRSPPSKALTDLLSREQHAEDIAKALALVRESDPYVFFYAYMQPKTGAHEAVWSNVEKLEELNSRLLASFLQALELAKIAPKRLARAPQPCVESDPQPRHLGSNFYYPQEDSLTDYCKRHLQTSWNMIRPFGVIGSAIKAQMSGRYLFCVYAAVQTHKNEPLYVPGDFTTWQGPTPMSTARLTGYLSEWAVRHDACENQAYNSIDSNSMTNGRFLAELAR